VEQLIGDRGFCFGATPGLADVYLIPQLYAAERFNIDLAATRAFAGGGVGGGAPGVRQGPPGAAHAGSVNRALGRRQLAEPFAQFQALDRVVGQQQRMLQVEAFGLGASRCW
jgi:glutathione S-transferase